MTKIGQHELRLRLSPEQLRRVNPEGVRSLQFVVAWNMWGSQMFLRIRKTSCAVGLPIDIHISIMYMCVEQYIHLSKKVVDLDKHGIINGSPLSGIELF